MSDAQRPRSPGTERLRRSMHFVPGGNERMFHKALATAADALILDLEDSVTPDAKVGAREAVAGWLRDSDFGAQERCVRINPLDTPWGLADIEASMASPPDLYLLPKISCLDELTRIDAHIAALETRFGHPLGGVGLIIVATETPLGVLNLPSFGRCPRVVGLTWGAEDLSAALGGTRNRGPDGRYLDVYRHCRVQTLLAAAAAGVQPLDTVYVDIRDGDGLRAESQESAWMGYTGKMTVHPAQIDIVNAAFSPSAEEVDAARRLLAAFAEAEAAGRMAFAFEGRMVDVPHLERARRLLARAERIAAHTTTT